MADDGRPLPRLRFENFPLLPVFAGAAALPRMVATRLGEFGA